MLTSIVSSADCTKEDVIAFTHWLATQNGECCPHMSAFSDVPSSSRCFSNAHMQTTDTQLHAFQLTITLYMSFVNVCRCSRWSFVLWTNKVLIHLLLTLTNVLIYRTINQPKPPWPLWLSYFHLRFKWFGHWMKFFCRLVLFWMRNFQLVIFILSLFISLFFDCIFTVGAVGRPNSNLNCEVIREIRYIVGAKSVELTGV